MLKIGYHVSVAGGVSFAFDRAQELGCTCMQLFLSNPRGWEMKETEDAEVCAFRSKHNRTGIEPVAHMPYLPNVASPRKSVYSRSVLALRETAERCELLGVRKLVAHMGSHLGEGKQEGMKRAAEAIAWACSKTEKVALLLENEAGQQNSMGSSVEDLLQLRELSGIDNVGFCLDTCHLFAAGYDIRDPEVTDDIFRSIGLEHVGAVHMNDAKHGLGSHLDRHENIGFGHIGANGFKSFFCNDDIRSKPVVLETPGMHAGARELALARKLVQGNGKRG